MQNAQRTLDNTAKRLNKIGAGMTLGVTTPLLALGAASVKNFDTQAKAIAQVEAGIRSVGGAIGYTSKELQKQASELQNNSLFGDENILKNVTAQLLTFTNIANEQFARTQQVALDLATRLDGDLKSASIQLGKALNDPVANLSALSRSGIQFSKDQKILINSLVEAGKVAEAQNVILEELERQYGGSAAAAAAAGLGPFTQLKNILGDITEEFGKIILEGFSPIIESTKNLSLRFFDLSEQSKKIIVIIAGIAAAIGPLLIVTGTLIRNINTIIPLIKALSVAIVSNPIGAFATAVTVLGGAALIAESRLSSLTDASAEFNNITAEAAKNISRESSELQKNLSIAKNEQASKEARVSAIRKLNQLSPEYLGNLKLEKINTEEATLAIKKYNEALLTRAKVAAAEEKLVEVQKKLLDLQLGQLEAVKPSVWQNAVNGLKAYGNSSAFVSESIKTTTGNLSIEQTELKKLQESLIEFISNNENVAESVKKVNQEIAKSTGKPFVAKLNLDTSGIKNISGDLGVFSDLSGLFKVDELDERSKAWLSKLVEFREGAREVLEQAAQDFISGFAEILGAIASGNAGFASLGSFLLGTVGQVLINLGKLAIQVAVTIEGIKKALQTLNPVVAAIAGAAAIALGTFIKNQAASFAGNFADGGLVPGNSFSGDRLIAGVNSGELILNIAQQKNLAAAIRSNGAPVILQPGLRFSGREMQVFLERVDNQNKRST